MKLIEILLISGALMGIGLNCPEDENNTNEFNNSVSIYDKKTTEKSKYIVYGLTCIDLTNSQNLIKIGMCENYKNRKSTYITSYPYNSPILNFVILCETKDEAKYIEFLLHCELYDDSTTQEEIYNGGGTEWFNKDFNIDIIRNILQNEGYTNKILIDNELIEFEENEKRKDRKYKQKKINQIKISKKNKNINVKNAFINFKNNKNESNKRKKPFDYQNHVLDIIEDFYNSNDIGKLLWSCGLGKGLMSMFITEKMKFKTVCYGVPNINLQKQIVNDILEIFPNKNNILFIGGEDYNGIISTNNTNTIEEFINNNNNNYPKFIITTYHSCKLLINIKFDFKIGDEAHHLVNPDKDKEKGFILFHKIPSTKTLFMTATEKNIISNDDNQYSMDNENIFGKCIDSKSIKWAIDNSKITDYNTLLLKNKEEDIDFIINKLKINSVNKDIFISTYMSLKSLSSEKYNNLSHILIYTNTTDNANLVNDYIRIILDKNIIPLLNNDNLYYNSLHSKNNFDLKTELDKFKQSKYGIISCVYLFGEGFNLPELNGVCIADNMYSMIRIIQYLLRANRLNKNVLNKNAYYILPYIDYDDYEALNTSYKKIMNIISQIREVDDILEQKIKLMSLKVNKNKKPKHNTDKEEYDDFILDDDPIELERIKIRLRHSKALKSKNTEEQDEYDYVKMINKELEIKSKPEYIQSKNKHQHFINEPEDYFTKNGVWINWYDFMNVDTSVFIQDKDEFVKFCKEKKINKNNYDENCEIYNCLPNIPDYFYKDFTFSQLNNSVRKRR